MHLRVPSRAAVGAALVCIAILGGCESGQMSGSHTSSSSVGGLHASTAGYDVPAHLPHAAPGTLIGARDAASKARVLGAARAWQVLYHSTDSSGHDTAVSGLVLVPKGVPPAPGWTVAAWAHGTTGLANRCAPSVAPDLGHDTSAVAEVRALLDQHFVVVASDYPGLGTPGVHTYLVGKVDSTAVIDSVTAAHSLLHGRISHAWITVGHSEGGQTALFVAQSAGRRAPHSRFLGTVALAPASTLNALIPLAEATADPVEQAYLVYALEGLHAVGAVGTVASLLSPSARAVLPDTTSGCIDDIVHDLTVHPVDHLLDVDAATKDRLSHALAANDNPDRTRAAEPILITQGTADTDVPEGATQGLVSKLCALGDHIDYRVFPGLDHNDLVAGSQTVITEWVDARLAGKAAPTSC